MRLMVALLMCGVLTAGEQKLRYWIEDCTDATSGCRSSDIELARWALDAWAAASEGALAFERSTRQEGAHIRVLWAGASRGNYGEMRARLENGVPVAEVYVRPAIVPAGEPDALLREAIVYLTCLHETGHALGLAHTAVFADIMYSFGYGGDIAEYFGRYRRNLKSRDDIRRRPGMSDADRQALRRALQRTGSVEK